MKRLLIALMLFTSCEKDAVIEPKASTSANIKYEYRYQINNAEYPIEFTIRYMDSTGKLIIITKHKTDCSLIEAHYSRFNEQMYIELITNQSDAEIILWLTKNDTAKVMATGHKKLMLNAKI